MSDAQRNAVRAVSDLTDEHIGWQIAVADPDPVIRRRTFVLGKIRTWAYEGVTTVGLLDTDTADGRIRGTERHYRPDTACEVIRQIRRPRKARRTGASR